MGRASALQAEGPGFETLRFQYFLFYFVSFFKSERIKVFCELFLKRKNYNLLRMLMFCRRLFCFGNFLSETFYRFHFSPLLARRGVAHVGR